MDDLKKTAGFSVFRADGMFITACKSPLQAAMLVSILGPGSSIRDSLFRRDLLWLEGLEPQAAGDDYDHVVETITERRLAREARAPSEMLPPMPSE